MFSQNWESVDHKLSQPLESTYTNLVIQKAAQTPQAVTWWTHKSKFTVSIERRLRLSWTFMILLAAGLQTDLHKNTLEYFKTAPGLWHFSFLWTWVFFNKMWRKNKMQHPRVKSKYIHPSTQSWGCNYGKKIQISPCKKNVWNQDYPLRFWYTRIFSHF